MSNDNNRDVSSATEDRDFVSIDFDRFIRAIQHRYMFKANEIEIRTEPTTKEPHACMPFMAYVRIPDAYVNTFGSKCIALNMIDFIQMFEGIPLIRLSSQYFYKYEDKIVETWSSTIHVNFSEDKTKVTFPCYVERMLSDISQSYYMLIEYRRYKASQRDKEEKN